MERKIIQEGVIQGIEKCKTTGITKTCRWFRIEEKKTEDLPKIAS